MKLSAGDPARYVGEDDVVDTSDPAVSALAERLRAAADDDAGFARAAFEWVRDEVAHSVDAGDPRVTVSASQVLRRRVGLCYAKSHLLVAVLRGGGIPAGLCYQRLGSDEEGFALHGLVAAFIDGTWHRLDPRGNKAGVDAQFSLVEERLAYVVDRTRGEVDYPQVYERPAPVVLRVLRGADDVLELCRGGLPEALPA